jgi:CBS domain-containing protein
MLVRDIMSKDLVTVDKGRNLRDVLAVMRQHRITKIPVVENGHLLGIVTDGAIADKLGRLHNRTIQLTTLHASGVMERDFLVAHPDEDLQNLLRDVGKPGLTMVPVLRGTKLEGVVTKADLLRFVESADPVASIMHTSVRAVSPEDRLIHARRLLLDHDIGRMPVLEQGRVVGIIAEHEIAQAFASFKEADPHVQRTEIRDLLVRDHMRRNPVVIRGEATCAEAAARMLEEHVGCLPIVDRNNRLEGIVTRTDLIRTFAPPPVEDPLVAHVPPRGRAVSA